jgi:NTP pyrophosphatase (non-canonical NTP hydrolase)
MITDRHGVNLDETTALQRIVAALDRRFPDHNTAGDRLGRLLEELGELAAAVIERETDDQSSVALTTALTKELHDVLRGAAGIAHHYGLPITLTELMIPPTDDDAEPGADPADPYEQLAHLTRCAGEVATAVHHQIGMGIKRDKHGQHIDHGWLTGAVHDVLRRVVQLAEHYRLREALRESIQVHYRRYQHDGYLTDNDTHADEHHDADV